jgi:hypothetical protein
MFVITSFITKKCGGVMVKDFAPHSGGEGVQIL